MYGILTGVIRDTVYVLCLCLALNGVIFNAQHKVRMWIKLCWPPHQKRQKSSVSYLSGGAQNTGERDSSLRSSVEVVCCHGDFVIYIFLLRG